MTRERELLGHPKPQLLLPQSQHRFGKRPQLNRRKHRRQLLAYQDRGQDLARRHVALVQLRLLLDLLLQLRRLLYQRRQQIRL